MHLSNTTEIEAAVFRRLVEHLQKNSQVQNIDLMILSGFCRNCLSNWYQEEAEKIGQPIDKESARQYVYGMPYDMWKKQYQTDVSQEKLDTLRQKK